MCLVLTYDYFSGVIISQWDEVFNTDLGICSNTLSGLEVRVRAGRTFVGPSLLWGVCVCVCVCVCGGGQLRVGHL